MSQSPELKEEGSPAAVQLDPEALKRKAKQDRIRDFSCGCGKNYLSYPALYLHLRLKHGGKAPENTVIFKSSTQTHRGRPRSIITSNCIETYQKLDGEDPQRSKSSIKECVQLLASLLKNLYAYESSQLTKQEGESPPPPLPKLKKIEQFFKANERKKLPVGVQIDDGVRQVYEQSHLVRLENKAEKTWPQVFAYFLQKISKEVSQEIFDELVSVISGLAAYIKAQRPPGDSIVQKLNGSLDGFLEESLQSLAERENPLILVGLRPDQIKYQIIMLQFVSRFFQIVFNAETFIEFNFA